MLPCKILRERTIDLGSLFSKEKEKKKKWNSILR